MAIFDALKKNKDTGSEEKKAVVVKEKTDTSSKKVAKKNVDAVGGKTVKQKTATLQNVLKSPRITEKAAILAEQNAYTFEVHPRASKIEIARAVKQIYEVEPVRVNIIKLPAKKVLIRGKRGTKKAVKKAIVYLKKGDKIEFV